MDRLESLVMHLHVQFQTLARSRKHMAPVRLPDLVLDGRLWNKHTIATEQDEAILAQLLEFRILGEIPNRLTGQESAFAHERGFLTSKTIWNLAENAELKKLRKNRLILLGGDRVFIPEPAIKDEVGQTDRRHVFAAAREGLELHVKVHDQGFQPIHGDATVTAGPTQSAMRQQGDIFQSPIRPDVTAATLDFPISKTERQRPQIPIQ